MNRINATSTGLALGTFLGFLHLLWSLCVALGVAQPLQTWVLSLHFLNNPFQVGAFNIGTALLLIVVTFLAGYVFGWVFATVWNMLHRG